LLILVYLRIPANFLKRFAISAPSASTVGFVGFVDATALEANPSVIVLMVVEAFTGPAAFLAPKLNDSANVA
jgi:hypothetical protein